ncbi:MAG TPA: hypothetical protein VGV57_08840 [Thermoleophilaceae bacterium]|nr:hypothetical protein [Thermoleophilaceae bacterium]
MAHFQYVLGLHRLGHQVWFLEEAGWEESCYDPERDEMTSDPTYGAHSLDRLAASFGLGDRWGYRDSVGRWHGLDGSDVDRVIAEADLFLDVGGTSHFPEMRHARRRAYVDMDPVFTQLGSFAHPRLDRYDVLFTYGANIGREGCAVPTGGFDWRPLRPPVVLDVWGDPGRESVDRIDGSWTTVAHWNAYGEVEHDGETYGQKDVEFMRLIHLPRRTSHRLEVAVSGEAPLEQLEANGWHVADPLGISRDPCGYRDYIRSSHGEFTVAKQAYVKARSGWFSDRTASYLASGRPVVVQDTGIAGDLPTGYGLVVFETGEEALAGLDLIEASYEDHCRAAREVAETYFDADVVLTGLLEEALGSDFVPGPDGAAVSSGTKTSRRGSRRVARAVRGPA